MAHRHKHIVARWMLIFKLTLTHRLTGCPHLSITHTQRMYFFLRFKISLTNIHTDFRNLSGWLALMLTKSQQKATNPWITVLSSDVKSFCDVWFGLNHPQGFHFVFVIWPHSGTTLCINDSFRTVLWARLQIHRFTNRYFFHKHGKN